MKDKCEPLRGKIVKFGDYPSFDFTEVKSAVEFYKRYLENPGLFEEEQPKEFKMFRKSYIRYRYLENKYTHMFYWGKWLFNYCFDDVIE